MSIVTKKESQMGKAARDRHGEYAPKSVQITTHISVEARQVLERAKADQSKTLGALISEAVLAQYPEYRD